jgi:hypothetical protein
MYIYLPEVPLQSHNRETMVVSSGPRLDSLSRFVSLSLFVPTHPIDTDRGRHLAILMLLLVPRPDGAS